MELVPGAFGSDMFDVDGHASSVSVTETEVPDHLARELEHFDRIDHGLRRMHPR